MFERESTLYAFQLGLCKLLSKDLDDTKLAYQPTPGTNHPAWILGHLAVATDYALRTLGEQPACPEDWHKKFGIGSTVVPERSAYPSKAELLSAIESGHERVTRALQTVSEERLQRPNKFEFLKAALPTLGDLIGHLMTTHVGFHLGQLSMWRRQMGFKPII
jgi:hypothetical protein